MITNHIAIQTPSLENSIRWYERFFASTLNWELDRFSETTRRRLPGIQKLVELQSSQVVFHIFERRLLGKVPHDPSIPCFQHICLEVETLQELVQLRESWFALHDCGEFWYARDEVPTEIEWDGTRSASFYMFDVNGVEYEVMWISPPHSRGSGAK